ncbi:hypothetical protein ACP275_03G001300 [Erythranthe tilingii]
MGVFFSNLCCLYSDILIILDTSRPIHFSVPNTRLSLCKKVLYEALVLPALRRDRGISRKERKSGYHEPFDLMHALYNIVIHGHVKPPLDRLSIDYNEEADLESSEEEIANEDMKYDEEDDSSTEGLIRLMASAVIGFSKSNVSRKRRFLCATELKEAGIRIKKLKNGGVRSINFTNYYWWPWAYLYLPVFVVEDNTEKVLQCLKTYELLQQQQVGKKRREFGSYLCLMSDIVQSSRDARMLEHEGVLVANSDGIGKVSGILRRLSSEDVALTPDFILLRSKLRDYTRPWARYKNVLNFVVFLTLLQTLFAILAYFKPPKA